MSALTWVFFGLSVGGALFTLNGLRPLAKAGGLGVPVFFAGWLTTELAPHNLVVVVLATIGFAIGGAVDGWAGWVGLGLDLLSVVGLVVLIRQSDRARGVIDEALVAGLGERYASPLLDQPVPNDLRVPWRQLTIPFRPKLPHVTKHRDVRYADGAGKRHLLDVYHRDDRPQGAPVLLQVHGGGWVIGTKDQQGLPLMNHLAARGWVCVAPNYRLAPRTKMGGMVSDVEAALAWTREHIAEYGGDPDNIVITGGSAGGHLCSLVALRNVDVIRACVAFYGVYDICGDTGHKESIRTREELLGRLVVEKRYQDDPELYASYSPIRQVRPDSPPFFVIHGAHDTLVPVVEARLLVEKLREISTSTVVYAELPGTQHGFEVFPSVRTAHVVRGVERFLSATVGRASGEGVAAPGSAVAS
ncbi:MAG TPA: alpha/beta hydrolase [Mycobacteriales bacterium]|nr:alpha/beta hydrolase [Mycobacteriales bacterium]